MNNTMKKRINPKMFDRGPRKNTDGSAGNMALHFIERLSKGVLADRRTITDHDRTCKRVKAPNALAKFFRPIGGT